MRVVINAQLDPQHSGGIAQVLVGLAHALGALDGPEEFLFVCTPQSAEWLQPYLGPNSRVTVNTKRSPAPRRGVRTSDGFFESFEPDVLHFPYQSYTQTAIPSVFNPHDFQHVHLPDFFDEQERQRRDALYTEACRKASAVVVASRFVKEDVIRCCGVPAENVEVIWWGSPSRAYAEPSAEQLEWARKICPDDRPFAVYPAQTWPHKNHLRLLEALASLRDQEGLHVPLVCTGAATKHFDAVRRRVSDLDLQSQVVFTGRVDESALMALYRTARMMIVPTLFEAISFPIFEAFAEKLPVACSNVTALPEQVGDAAVVFDPYDVVDMARKVAELYRSEDLRADRIRKGSRRLSEFAWGNTAEAYRSLYRRVAAGRPPGTITPPCRDAVKKGTECHA